MYVNGNGATFTNISMTTIAYNAASSRNSSGHGGALYIDGGATWLDSNIMTNNSADAYGGAIFYAKDCFQVVNIAGNVQNPAWLDMH